jgi:hypothetical protein
MLHVKFGQIPLESLVAVSKETTRGTGGRMDGRTDKMKIKVPRFCSGPKKKHIYGKLE